MRARHNNCSTQQKAEIPIQSLELILRTAGRKLGSPDIGCNDDERRSTGCNFLHCTAPSPLSLSTFPLKTNNERDQSLTAGRDLGRRTDGRAGDDTKNVSNASSYLFNSCLWPIRERHHFRSLLQPNNKFLLLFIRDDNLTIGCQCTPRCKRATQLCT